MPGVPRKPTSVSLDADLPASARELGINVSRACEGGLAAQVQKAKEERWLAENREAIAASNAYVERHGLPLARYRMF